MNDRWERLSDLYHAAVTLPADERATLLAEECADDPLLRADVERLVGAHDRASQAVEPAAIVDSTPPPGELDTVDAAGPVQPLAPSPTAKEEARRPMGAVTDSVDGEPIDAYADNRQLSVAERLQLFLQVCNAVASAHRRGVAYGDLTPATIRIAATGVPKLPGFDLGADDATPATDVHSLGIVLDRLLGIGVSAGSRGPLRRELDGTVLKALRREGSWRYESVEALADDVQRYLDAPPARERRTARRPRPTKPRQRRVGAVVAWVLAGVAVTALGATVAPLLERRAESAPPVSQPDAPAARARVRVGDLEDRAQDPQLAAALSDALRAGLTESPSVAVVSARGKSTDAEVAGSIAGATGGAYTIAVQLTQARAVDGPTMLEEVAVDSTDVIRALGRLSERLRAQLGESSTSIAVTPRLEDVTTASVPALRSFTNASRAIRAGDRAGGIRWLRAAVALDTGFASAHRLLGLTYRDVADRTRSREALDHAVANQARLPFYERNQTLASQAMTLGAGYAIAIDAYNRILARDPGDARVLNSLGAVHAARREYAVQESLLVRAIAVDTDVASFHTGLAMAAVNQGKYGAARRVLDRTEQRFPGLRSTQLASIALAASQQDWSTAERAAREMVARAAADSLDALDARETLGRILMTQGRLAEAEQEFRRAIALGVRRGAVRQSFTAALGLAYLELRYRHSPGAAVATMSTMLARFPVAKIQADDRPPYAEVARLFVDAGQPRRAGELMAQAARMRGQSGDEANRRWTAGTIAMAEGRAWEGEIEIHGAAESHPCPICALPDLARAYEVAGKPDSAIATYERYLHAPWQRRHETDAAELGLAMKRLGELYQQQNDRGRAAAQYTALLQLWHGADPELGPLLTDVRRRLEQTGEAIVAR